MAQSITNTANFPYVIPGIPAAHVALADQTATTAAQNSGIVGLLFARCRVRVKTFGTLAAADTSRFTLQVGTGSAITGPVNIAQVTITVETGDTELTFDLDGWSQVGFQSWKVLMTNASSHTATFDLIFDAQ